MKKKIVSISLALGLCLTSITGFAKSSNPTEYELELDKGTEISSPIEYQYELDEEVLESFINSSEKESTESKISTYAAAPTLRYLEVVAVGSPLHESKTGKYYEDISRLQFSTKEDHGGGHITIVTYELGISTSTSQRAKFNGKDLALDRRQFIDTNGDRIIDGYMCYWTVVNPTNEYGEFTYEARSMNFPYNSMSDSINIR